jgi:hypothetical protein
LHLILLPHAGYKVISAEDWHIEQWFGWGKVIGSIRQGMVQGLDNADQIL